MGQNMTYFGSFWTHFGSFWVTFERFSQILSNGTRGSWEGPSQEASQPGGVQ